MYPLSWARSVTLLASPTIKGMISRQYPKELQGELIGTLTSAKNLTAVVAPLIFNNLFVSESNLNSSLGLLHQRGRLAVPNPWHCLLCGLFRVCHLFRMCLYSLRPLSQSSTQSGG